MTTEGLLSRVKRLVSGGVNSLVDAVENVAPETVMKEAIREIDRASNELRDRLGVVLANRHHANKRLADATTRHEDLVVQLTHAVAENRDDLAEAAIARQLDLEAQLPVLEQVLSGAGSEAKEIEGYISALAARRREMESDLAHFVATRDAATSADMGERGLAGARPVERRIEKAENAFNRVLMQVTGVPGTTASDRTTAAKLAELEEIERNNRIRERLVAAKAKS
jgi:phage shock protein A